MPSSFAELFEIAKKNNTKKICVVCAHDDDVLKSVSEAYKNGLGSSILIGDKEKILKISNDEAIDISFCEIYDQKDNQLAASLAVSLVKEKKADILMKGKIQTPDLMKAVLNKENGLRTSELLSHVGIFESPNYHKLLFVTDGGLNINPDLQKKISIVNNAVTLAHSLGILVPKVAGLAAIELVNQDMPATIDTAALTLMSKRGQLNKCIFDGPLALDNAISKESATIKGIVSEVAGDADILLVPDIEAGNIMIKSLTYLAGFSWGGVVLGAKCPIVLASRADNYEAKLNSIAIAVAMKY